MLILLFFRSNKYILSLLNLLMHHLHQPKAMTARVPNIKGFEFDIAVDFYRQGDFIIAYSPDFDLSTYSKSIEGAKTAFEDALAVFLEETLAKGTFFNELKELGWKMTLVPIPNFIKPSKTRRHNRLHSADIINSTNIPVQIPIHA